MRPVTDMELTLTRRHPVPRTRAAALCAQSTPAASPVCPRRAIGAGGPNAERLQRPAREGVLAVWILALIAVAIVGGLLVLFSWVTAMLPPSQLMACPEFDGCATQASDTAEPVPPEDPWLDEPRMVP